MFSLQTRMALLLTAFFGIIFAIITVVGTMMGMRDFYFYLLISFGMMWLQYMIGPKIIEWTMQIKYIKREDNPKLFAMTEAMCRQANIPMPRLCISAMQIPNAFAFGRGINDGRVCVTEGIMRLLNEEELRAVVGHELAHIKNRDVLTITLLSVVPMILYRVAWHFMFYGNRRDGNNSNAANGMLIGVAAFLFYFITNLLVLYASRIREYYADKGSVEMGNKPAALASALYKLVYGSARMANSPELKEAEGMKAFFANDPSQALHEIKDLKQLDLDRDGTIDTDELFRLRNKTVRVGTGEKMMEFLSTHPNMLKRIKHLSELK